MTDEELIRTIDRLEEQAESYVSLEDVEHAAGQSVAQSIADGILLVDHRTRLDGSSVTVCRLNRHHPLVMKLTGW